MADISQINLTNQVKDDSLTNAKIKLNVITGDRLVNGTLTNTQINANAQIDVSKLNTTPASVAFDSTGALKTGAAAPVDNDNILSVSNGGTPIVYSKLNLQEGGSGNIVNADISSAAAIDQTKFKPMTASRVVQTGTGGILETANVTAAELDQISGILKPGDIGYVGNIQAQLNLKLPYAGGTMTGPINMGGTQFITNLPEPTFTHHAATKNYVDSLVTGLQYRPAAEAIKVLTHSATAPSTPAVGDHYISAVDGILRYWNGTAWTATGVTFDGSNGIGKYVVVHPTPIVGEAFDGKGNNIAKWTGAAWTFETPVDAWAIFIHEGYYSNNGFVYEDSPAGWNQFSGAGQIDAGIGLKKDGNLMYISMGAGITQLPSDEVGVDILPNGGLRLTSTDTDGQLAAQVDSSSIEVSAGGNIQIKADGVQNSHINANVAGSGIKQNTADGSLEVNVDTSVALQISSGAVDVKIDGIKDYHVDWGTGANQINLDDIPESIAQTNKYFTDERAQDAIGTILPVSGTTSVDLTYDDATPSIRADARVDNSSIEIESVAKQLRVKANGITGQHLNSSVAGAGLSGGAGSALSVNVGNGLSLPVDTIVVDAGTAANQIPQLTANAQLALGAGSVSNPTYSFSGTVNTGMYLNGSSLAFPVAGVDRLTMSTSAMTFTLPIREADGTAAAPSFSFTNATGVGLYYPNVANTLCIATSGVERVRVDANGYVGILKTPTTALDVNGTVTATAFSGNGANISNVNAVTLDNVDSSEFIRSNTSDAVTDNAVITFQSGTTLNMAASSNFQLAGTSVVATAAELNNLGTFVDFYEPTGAKNGLNPTFVVNGGGEVIAGSLRLYKNGQQLREGAGFDYTFVPSTGTITFLDSNAYPVATDSLWCHYRV